MADRSRILASGRWSETGKGIRPWRDNAEMIADACKLFVPRNARVLDPTYGEGNWWTEYRPKKLVAHDLAIDGVDFRYLPYRARSFGAVFFDPPYVSKGGRSTSGIPAFDKAYGLKGAPRSPKALQALINEGCQEAWRVLRPGGVLAVKAMNYVSSGRTWMGIFLTTQFVLELPGAVFQAEMIFVSPPGPQPLMRKVKGKMVKTEQQHAAHNASSLLVFTKR